MLIPCQHCRKEYPAEWHWYRCNQCCFRTCSFCLSKHHGAYSKGGFKCSQCAFGHLEDKKT